MVFDIKKKLTDEEYKNIMDGIKKIDEKKFIRIYYNSFIAGIDYDDDDDEPAGPKLTWRGGDKICQVLDKPSEECEYHSISCDSVIDPDVVDLWIKKNNEKLFWPQIFRGGENAYMVVSGFEEL